MHSPGPIDNSVELFFADGIENRDTLTRRSAGLSFCTEADLGRRAFQGHLHNISALHISLRTERIGRNPLARRDVAPDHSPGPLIDIWDTLFT